MDDRMYLRRTTDRGNTRIDTTQKFLSQTSPPCFVPCVRLCDILLDFRRNDQLSGHSDDGSGVSLLPTRVLRQGFASGWPFFGPALLCASYGLVQSRGSLQGHPTSLLQVGVSPRGSGQRWRSWLSSLETL